jgi:hypothetical protein
MHDDKHSESAKHKRLEVYWTTVSYKTLTVYGSLVLVVVLATLFLIYPDWFSSVFRRLAAALDQPGSEAASSLVSQARFINLEGKVEVRKVNSTRWVSADYRMPLEKGDLVQTGPDGLARVTFADGTTYTVKSDTLITVEENSVAQDKSTRVAVSITTGEVDLTTPQWDSAKSSAEVSFENAVASMRENSRAAVRTDPTKKQHEITVSAGGAEVQRGGERITLAQWEKVSFPTGGPVMKSRVLAPPALVEPVNLKPIIEREPRRAAIRFQWSPVPGAAGYQLRVSRTSLFTQVVADRRVKEASASITGLDVGDYFWAVTALDAENRPSEPSETYKFSLAAQGRGQDMLLDIEGTQLHGNVVEVIGRTEPGAAILVNGQPVANIGNDGRFRHFTERLERGSHTIVVIGQNRRGGFAKKEVPIVVP